jgi:hypothetical protein
MKRDVPYAIILPIVVVCFAMVLMIWAMAGTSGARVRSATDRTTGTVPTRSNQNAIRAPLIPNNNTASDSARAASGPENKSR